MNDIQSTINEIAKKTDRRSSIFEIEIQSLKNKTLRLGGRVLHASQLEELSRLLPDLRLDTSSVQIVSRGLHVKVHVATNLTGLYEKPTFGLPLSSELTYGTELEVLDVDHDWVFTRQPDGYLGWVYRPYVNEAVLNDATHLILAPVVEVRTEPNETCEAVTRLVGGTAICVEESHDGWSRVNTNRSGWIPSKNLRAIKELPETTDEKRRVLQGDAGRMLGVPYLWGGTSGHGIDCSGFARLLHRWVGTEIPRDADMQYAAAAPVEPPYKPGDLLFFKEGDSNRAVTHVAVSQGGWDIIHSSRGNNGVYLDDLREKKPLMDIFVSAGSFLR